MDKKSLELAGFGLDAAYQQLRPGYIELADELTKELALSKSQDAEATDAVANAHLLSNFTAELPRAITETKVGIRSRFVADTPAQARAIQSSVAWLRAWSGAVDFAGAGMIGFPFPNGDFMVRPYWILGEAHQTRHHKQFLLVPATDPLTHRADLDRGNYADYDSWSPVRRLIRRAGSSLVILNAGRQATGRLAVVNSNLFDMPLRQDERYPAAIDHRSEGAEVLSLYGRVALHKMEPTKGITDYQLAAFGVFDKINRLATLFDKKDLLHSLLTNYPQQISEEAS